MINFCRIRGFSLITSIFLLVVVGLLMGYMVNLRVLQQSTVVMAIQGARAMQAARAGLEYAMFQALSGGCVSVGSPLDLSAVSSFSGFTVTLTCTESEHEEGLGPFNVYTLTSVAEKGVFALTGNRANPDYVSRRLRATVSNTDKL